MGCNEDDEEEITNRKKRHPRRKRIAVRKNKGMELLKGIENTIRRRDFVAVKNSFCHDISVLNM